MAKLRPQLAVRKESKVQGNATAARSDAGRIAEWRHALNVQTIGVQ